MITADLVRDLIVAHDAARPRSKQTAIGPSDLSSPCNRRLVYQILGVPKVAQNTVNLYAYVGTGLHRQLQDAADRHPDRWLTEIPVSVPVTDDVTIPGHADAYDKDTHTVVDWKSCGTTRPSAATRDKHHTQLLPYGLGLILAGHTVEHCAVVYIPRNGKLSEIEVDVRPFDQAAAEALLRRYEALLTAASAGTAALPLIPAADDCTFCGWWLPGWPGDPSEACPGAQALQTTGTQPEEPNPTQQPERTRP